MWSMGVFVWMVNSSFFKSMLFLLNAEIFCTLMLNEGFYILGNWKGCVYSMGLCLVFLGLVWGNMKEMLFFFENVWLSSVLFDFEAWCLLRNRFFLHVVLKDEHFIFWIQGWIFRNQTPLWKGYGKISGRRRMNFCWDILMLIISISEWHLHTDITRKFWIFFG